MQLSVLQKKFFNSSSVIDTRCLFKHTYDISSKRKRREGRCCTMYIVRWISWVEGSWYKNGYPQDNHLRATSWSIAISHEPLAWKNLSFGWRLGYQDLGWIKSSNRIPSGKDPQTGQICGDCAFQHPDWTYIVNEWDGRGWVRGMILGGTLVYTLYGVSLQIEGGYWLYWATWDENGGDVRSHNSGASSYYYGVRIKIDVYIYNGIGIFASARFFPYTFTGENQDQRSIYRSVNCYEGGISIPLRLF